MAYLNSTTGDDAMKRPLDQELARRLRRSQGRPGSAYFDELCRAMTMLAKERRAVFMGQAVEYPGTAMFRTLRDVPIDKRVELPVAEDMQAGMATGAALNGDLPICIYPRWDFMLLAASQIVLHLDRLPLMSGYRPRVIIRTAAPSKAPLDPGPQHTGDHTSAFRLMLQTINVVRLITASEIVPAYERAVRAQGSTILVETSGAY